MSDDLSRRVLLVIPSLRGGGAERVFALVAAGLSARGFDIHLALAQREGHWLDTLPRSIVVHDLQAPKVRSAAWPLWKLTRRLRPAALVSTMTHMNKLVGLIRASLPRRMQVILRESTVLHLDAALGAPAPGPLHRAAYRAADRIICLTDGMRDALQQRFKIPWDRLVRIYNPLGGGPAATRCDPADLAAAPRFPAGTGPHLISIGRMDETKGFDRLLAAFPACRAAYPGATLTLLGDGPDRAALVRQAAALRVAERVSMPGFQSRVEPWLRAASLFVMASRFEGLPNVLLEAIDAECPLVALEHPGGTSEVLDLVGLTGRVTGNLTAWPDEWFSRPHPQVRERAQREFGLDVVVNQYAELIKQTDTARIAAA